jgi:hypothetical protein
MNALAHSMDVFLTTDAGHGLRQDAEYREDDVETTITSASPNFCPSFAYLKC